MKTPFLLLICSSIACHGWPIYQLHEWGTFTTVAGSDGTLLSGLEREEETLPGFAHSHLGLENGQAPDPAEISRIYRQHGTLGITPPLSKGLGRRPLTGVTVKMETPVIYFHSREIVPIPAKVRVGFEGGTISQWYPQRSGGEVLPEPPSSPDPVNQPTPISAWTLDFTRQYRGSIEAPGLRVFWVLPRETTDRLLPLEVSPPPAEIVRVLVGRSEVLRPRQEAAWLAASRKTGDAANPWNHIVRNDRFGLAIQERVKALESVAAITGR